MQTTKAEALEWVRAGVAALDAFVQSLPKHSAPCAA